MPALQARRRGRPKATASTEDVPQLTPAAEREVQLRKLLVSVDDMAWMLSIGKSKAWQLVMRGDVFSVPVGRSRRIPVKCIEEFVDSLMASAS
ncbi:MAG TPA: helix-turn-helix domain-containing protein [Ktedonobacterales bacterium]|nr:helix-turn-helix domain-containing protein [Ktedonobacterales bacterium]